MAGPTSFADLNTVGWQSGTTVAVTVTTGTRALVFFGARSVASDSTGGLVEMAYRVSGATTIVAVGTSGTRDESGGANDENSVGRVHYVTVTAGSNTFTLQALLSDAAHTATIRSPYITVIAL